MNFYKIQIFNSQDVFKKHKDFIFTNGNPMSGDTIRNVRREIMKTLGIKIPYESSLFQMLKEVLDFILNLYQMNIIGFYKNF